MTKRVPYHKIGCDFDITDSKDNSKTKERRLLTKYLLWFVIVVLGIKFIWGLLTNDSEFITQVDRFVDMILSFILGSSFGHRH